ncbi:XRE family transcriptional regulator (plasmid) [Streptomyces sp. NBC_01707]|uniref:helix-turn-helix domain-containing protein n=1 Tax=Streptomyces sp. NBC_01707 TaxID=2975914 RepID=UPI002F90DD9C
MESHEAIALALAEVGPQLRRHRMRRGVTLTTLATATGISKSTLSRLESGQRRPGLELLLPIVQALRISLDDVVQAVPQEGPFNQLKPQPWNGMVRLPLARQIGPIQAFKLVVPVGRAHPDPQSHDGRMWLYVLSGSLRLVLGDKDLQVRVGESAEFCTRVPHWFGNNCHEPVEALCLFGRQGEQVRPIVTPSTAGHSRDSAAATLPSPNTLHGEK